MNTEDLPHEVILSIQRVLEIEPNEEVDRLDGLSEKFNAVEILNDFFPDGAHQCLRPGYLQIQIVRCRGVIGSFGRRRHAPGGDP